VNRWAHAWETEILRTAVYALGQLYAHPKLTRQSFEALAAEATGATVPA
jgi:hypothetical protein